MGKVRFVCCASCAALLGAATLAIMPTAALACAFGYCFGAIAVGPGGAFGAASHRGTAADAVVEAQRNCADGCDRVEVFHSGCAALVTDRTGREWFGFGKTLEGAIDEAMLGCEMTGGQCALRYRLCSQ